MAVITGVMFLHNYIFYKKYLQFNNEAGDIFVCNLKKKVLTNKIKLHTMQSQRLRTIK